MMLKDQLDSMQTQQSQILSRFEDFSSTMSTLNDRVAKLESNYEVMQDSQKTLEAKVRAANSQPAQNYPGSPQAAKTENYLSPHFYSAANYMKPDASISSIFSKLQQMNHMRPDEHDHFDKAKFNTEQQSILSHPLAQDPMR
mmetsp:Transcript_1211/g.1369  ORF Transcript_1211/g.1369 Transcript_1211/m.1369 type:complete len:142 (+) Transcript_1211:642-1067(+)